MKSVLKVKMMVDAAMVLVLLLLMGYGLVGEEACSVDFSLHDRFHDQRIDSFQICVCFPAEISWL